MVEQLEYATPMGNSILESLSGTPATNDRSANNQENEIYGIFKRLLTEVELNEAAKDSPVLLDWRKIQRNDYQETLAPFQGNKNNDNQHMQVWDNMEDDDSLCWSHSSSF